MKQGLLFLKLTDITGVGKSTAEKLEKAGFLTIEDLQGITVEDLIKIGIHENTAEKIVGSVKELEEVQENLTYHVEDANEFVMFAFKKSEDYDEDHLEESFDNWYKKVLIADEKLKQVEADD